MNKEICEHCETYDDGEGITLSCALHAAARELLVAAKQVTWKLSHNFDDGPSRITRQDATARMLADAIARTEAV